MNYRLFFTLDYEIHGNGDGNPMSLMVEPTYRLMNLLEEYHQQLTIMADVAEILCFRRYREQTGRDDFHVAEIEEQLRDAIRRGHDVQLHIHSSYFKAQWNGHHFVQYIEEYNMAALPYQRINEMVTECISYLEQLLRPVKEGYKVWLFRAANWSMMPTANLYRVLVEHGITHDTSVYKGGCQGGNVCYDYREAYDNLYPYTASLENINRYAPNGLLTELPIYTEMRPFYAFISPIRIFRMVRAKFHKHRNTAVQASNAAGEKATEERGIQTIANKNDNRKLTIRSFFVKSPLKMDFNQLRSSQLITMMKHIQSRTNKGEAVSAAHHTIPLPMLDTADTLPIILIGHAKTFIPYNETTLRPFLQWIECTFSTEPI